MPRSTKPKTGWIEGLDGLRALAVLAVLAFHLWPSVVTGGFLGVDVFFVISGFLITTLLLRERDKTGRIDLIGFWRRRARRLIPALVLVVVTSVAVAAVLADELLVNIERQTIGAFTFSTNWLEIAAGTDYFGSSEQQLFATFWYLAVSEQFYLVWPLVFVVVLAVKRTRTHLWRWAAVLAATSALLMAVLFDPDVSPTRVYYGTDTHLFGLMIGVTLALAYAGPSPVFTSGQWQRVRHWIGFAALAGLVPLFVVVDSDSPSTYRGGILLASLLAGIIVASLPGGRTSFISICEWRPLAWMGERSYGIYLWHWPILLLVSSLMPAVPPGAGPSWVTVLLVLGFTMTLSEASYRWVEMPIRENGFGSVVARYRAAVNGPIRRTRLRLELLSLCAAVVVAIAVMGFLTAPSSSQAQLSVEAGQAAIASQPDLVAPAATTRQSVEPAPAVTTAPLEPAPAVTTAPPAPAPAVTTAPPAPPALPSAPVVDELPPDVTTGQPAAWPPDMALPPGDHIIGFGDSVMSGAAPALFETFPGIFLDAKPIRQWRDAPEIVQSRLDDGTMRNVVILNFGTNAGFKTEASQQALRDILDALGPDRRVVLVTVVGISYWVPSSNAMLGEISTEYPNTIVADWHAVIQDRPHLLHADRTHPNVEGIAVYADLVANALQDLGPVS